MTNRHLTRHNMIEQIDTQLAFIWRTGGGPTGRCRVVCDCGYSSRWWPHEPQEGAWLPQQEHLRISRTMHGRDVSRPPYAPECQYQPETNEHGLGRIQRTTLTYLTTAPAGLSGPRQLSGPPDYTDLAQHGEPYGVDLETITRVVYDTTHPSPPQIRAVQRAVRRLEELDLVDCWHGVVRYDRQPRKAAAGADYSYDRPVPGLYVAARWHCDHLPSVDAQ